LLESGKACVSCQNLRVLDADESLLVLALFMMSARQDSSEDWLKLASYTCFFAVEYLFAITNAL
jgi:hypothetical protein